MIKEENSTREKAEELIKNLRYCIENNECKECELFKHPLCVHSMLEDAASILSILLSLNEELEMNVESAEGNG